MVVVCGNGAPFTFRILKCFAVGLGRSVLCPAGPCGHTQQMGHSDWEHWEVDLLSTTGLCCSPRAGGRSSLRDTAAANSVSPFLMWTCGKKHNCKLAFIFIYLQQFWSKLSQNHQTPLKGSYRPPRTLIGDGYLQRTSRGNLFSVSMETSCSSAS